MEHKSQQISHLSEEVETLSSYLQEKEFRVTQLESKLESYHKVASTSMQFSDIVALTTEITELKQRLQEAVYQKQQASLERDAAIQETKEKRFENQLHAQLGKFLRNYELLYNMYRCVYDPSDEPPVAINFHRNTKSWS